LDSKLTSPQRLFSLMRRHYENENR
jgi:hypothetical protein